MFGNVRESSEPEVASASLSCGLYLAAFHRVRLDVWFLGNFDFISAPIVWFWDLLCELAAPLDVVVL